MKIELQLAGDLISREVLLAEYDRQHEGEPGKARKLIKEVPTVDAVEVVHGRWVGSGQWNHKPYRMKNKEKWQTYLCSECGHSNGRRFNDKYCPNCGAKMDGDGDG
jgi:rubrerythrin